MNVAYFSTVETTISSSSYSLLTSSGRLLMIDISFLLVSYVLLWTRAKHSAKTNAHFVPWAGATPHDSLGSRRLPKVGSLQPNSVFCPRPKVIAAPCASSTLPLTSVHPLGERNGEQSGDLCLSCTVHRLYCPQQQETSGLSPDRYRRTQFYRESVGRIPSADRALLALRHAMLGTDS